MWTFLNSAHAGNDFASAQQLLECLWAYEEGKTEKAIDSDADFVARAEELRRHAADSLVGSNSSSTTTGVATEPATAQQTGSAQESQCVVCMSDARSVVLIPCGHLAVCQSCYSRLQQCPICRSLIRGAIRSYLSWITNPITFFIWSIISNRILLNQSFQNHSH